MEKQEGLSQVMKTLFEDNPYLYKLSDCQTGTSLSIDDQALFIAWTACADVCSRICSHYGSKAHNLWGDTDYCVLAMALMFTTKAIRMLECMGVEYADELLRQHGWIRNVLVGPGFSCPTSGCSVEEISWDAIIKEFRVGEHGILKNGLIVEDIQANVARIKAMLTEWVDACTNVDKIHSSLPLIGKMARVVTVPEGRTSALHLQNIIEEQEAFNLFLEEKMDEMTVDPPSDGPKGTLSMQMVTRCMYVHGEAHLVLLKSKLDKLKTMAATKE